MDEKIGFLALEKVVEDSGYIGALLVTDDLGKPEEFRVSFPVKPTALQRQLYGESMLPHIGVSLCGVPLYQSLKNKPEIIVLSDRRFLPISDHTDCYAVFLSRRGERLEVKEVSNTKRDDEQETPAAGSAGFQPISVAYPQAYDEEKREKTKAILMRFSKSIDLLEPFERIKGALEALAEQDDRFR